MAKGNSDNENRGAFIKRSKQRDFRTISLLSGLWTWMCLTCGRTRLKRYPMSRNSFNIYPDENLVSIRWDQAPLVRNWYHVLQRILMHVDYRRGMRLITFSDGKWEPVTREHVQQVLYILECQSNRMSPMSMAVVAPAACDFGMARMMEALSERTPIVVRAFTCRSKAVEWLRNPVRYEHYTALAVA